MVNRKNGSMSPIEISIGRMAMSADDNYAIRGDRLARLIVDVGLSQAELARRIGVKQPSIAALISGKSQTTRHLHRIARELKTTPEYLTGEDDDAGPALVEDDRREVRRGSEHGQSMEEMGLVAIKEIDLALGAGATYIRDGAVMEVQRWFPLQWLREFTDAPPEMLVFARVRGDSMKPTIEPNGIVIIDLRKKRIDEQDSIWAIAIADIGMVKRIWANPDGSYKIKSDNERIGRPETAVDDEMYVLGRVVGGFSKF